jgi:FxsC-like protein
MQSIFNPYFFISYARGDRNDTEPYIKTFFDDLSREVSSRGNDPVAAVGFLDATNIEAGDAWPETLQTGLQASRVMVSLYSPKYFNSPYCGREWEIFRLRQQAYLAAAGQGRKNPPVILPVLWMPAHWLPKALPEAVTDIQYKHDSFGEVYAKEGLRYLMRLNSNKDAYQEFLTRFADQIVQVATDYPLPPLLNFPELKKLDSAFVIRNQKVAASGPNTAELVFIAAGRDELTPIKDRRTNLVFYGDSGSDWRPYHPEVQEDIWLLAQKIAIQANFRTDRMTIDAKLIDKIAEAQRGNQIVVIIIDTWALLLDFYAKLMRKYDERRFLNSVVLILWNLNDQETYKQSDALDETIVEVFTNITATNMRDFYGAIRSQSELEEKLKTSLNEIRMRIINKGEAKKRISSLRMIAQPLISAIPGGPA